MNKLTVTVTYVGHTDFQEAFPPSVDFHALKVQAMRHFSLELSASDAYVLQYDGADLPEHGHLSELNADPAMLRLVLKDEVPKGFA
jgi:hypothetical protein